MKKLNLKVPLPVVRSTVILGARKTNNVGGIINEYYTKTYAPADLYSNLKFAMRFDLKI